MKTGVKTWLVLLLVGLLGSSCATASRVDAEFEEETARLERMSPAEKAEYKKAKRDREKLEWEEYIGGGDNGDGGGGGGGE